MRSTTAIAILLASTLVLLGGEASAVEPPRPPPSECTEELVRFSPCLPYVSSPPNNLSDSAPSNCCDAFSSATESGGALCLCYLVQDPQILGFPVNDTRVLSLSSTCPLGNATRVRTSLESLCSGSPELPPLRSPTISGISSPADSGSKNASSPLMGFTPESTNNSSPQPSSPPSSAVEPARESTAMKQIYKSNAWFLPAILSFLVPISTILI